MPSMSLWNAHPKVSIPLDHGGEARCPYCSTLYHFKGELPKPHH
ncbi:MAG: zinc-finger domain-containing protein [Nitrosomonadales bacterium]|nr:zinc-finger domain-containing protein [Nitrosomonadales bacterium]